MFDDWYFLYKKVFDELSGGYAKIVVDEVTGLYPTREDFKQAVEVCMSTTYTSRFVDNFIAKARSYNLGPTGAVDLGKLKQMSLELTCIVLSDVCSRLGSFCTPRKLLRVEGIREVSERLLEAVLEDSQINFQF